MDKVIDRAKAAIPARNGRVEQTPAPFHMEGEVDLFLRSLPGRPRTMR
jgi:hypothetical protein